jgi:hypothetical protein
MWNEMKVYSYLLSVDYGLAIKTLVLTEVKSFKFCSLPRYLSTSVVYPNPNPKSHLIRQNDSSKVRPVR